MKNTVRELQAARSLIEDRWHWTKGALQHGHAYCAVGALRKARASGAAFVALRQQLPPGFCRYDADMDIFYGEIESFNDRLGTRHADILALFDRAIVAEGGFLDCRRRLARWWERKLEAERVRDEAAEAARCRLAALHAFVASIPRAYGFVTLDETPANAADELVSVPG